MDAGGYRPRPLRRRFRLFVRTNAGRRAGRRRALGASRRRHRHCGHLPQRRGLRRASGFSNSFVSGNLAGACKLRTRSDNCRHQSWSRRPRRDRRTAGTQRPICLDRQRPGGGRNGCVRVSSLRPRRVRCDGHSAGAGSAIATRNCRERDRPRARPWCNAAAARQQAAHQGSHLAA